MNNKGFIIGVILLGLMSKIYSQKTESFKAINEVYYKFQKAFDSLDYELFAEIHSKNLIRIPGGKRIIDYNSYIGKQTVSFERAKKDNSTKSIDLRFIERVNNDSIASDRGIYKYVTNKNLPNEKTSYGKFHVLMIKENGCWKILMDYDSAEGKIINEEDFNQAIGMNDFEKFTKK